MFKQDVLFHNQYCSSHIDVSATIGGVYQELYLHFMKMFIKLEE